jgi:hypothetical protein
LEAKVEKLYKEAKGYLDAVRGSRPQLFQLHCMFLAMTIAQQRMAETVNMFYDESSPLAQLGLRYKDSANRLDEEVRTSMVCLKFRIVLYMISGWIFKSISTIR